MRHIRLIAVCDEYDPTPGLVLKGTRISDGLMADRDGLLIAHDLLEHQNGPAMQGTVWDELEALGGIWYARGQWGDMMTEYGSHYSPAVNVASDVTRMFGEWDGDDCPGGRRIGTRRSDYDEDFAEVLEIARRDIPREHDDCDRDEMERYLALALRRMRSGFRKARRRFERNGRFYGNMMMRAVKDAVARAVKYIEYEGQEFILSYGDGRAVCREAVMPWE